MTTGGNGKKRKHFPDTRESLSLASAILDQEEKKTSSKLQRRMDQTPLPKASTASTHKPSAHRAKIKEVKSALKAKQSQHKKVKMMEKKAVHKQQDKNSVVGPRVVSPKPIKSVSFA